MKKIYLAAIMLALGGTHASAQLFQHLYGTTNSEALTDGHNTSSGGQNGHFLVAPSGTAVNQFTATRTDASGNIGGAPFFNNQYRLSTTPGGTGSRIREVKSVEINGSGNYGLAGGYIDNAPTGTTIGVFYQQLDQAGNPLGTATGYFPASPASSLYNAIRVNKIINSMQTGDLYILGTITEASGGYNRIFVLRIQQNGTLVWSKVYRLDYSSPTNTDIPFDIVESAVQRNATYEVMVVGDHYQKLGGMADGFLLRIDYTSGNMINPVQFYGTAKTNEGFTCIKNAGNPNVDPMQSGYVIGGHITKTSSSGVVHNDYWFLAAQQSGAVSWSYSFDYSNGTPTSNNDYCRDIVEANNGGMYEYYLAGYTDNGLFGNEDGMVIHADQNGNGIANGQFTYGTKDLQTLTRIDYDNVSSQPGIALFGTNFHVPQPTPPLGGTDLWLVKADFNGKTGCEYDLRDPYQDKAPGFLSDKNNDNVYSFTSYPLYTVITGTMNDVELCASCSGPKPTVIAHWNFTDSSLVDDANGLTGVRMGGVTPTAGLLGVPNTAFQFDGTSGYIQVPSSTLLDLQSWTLTALVQPQGFYSGTCQGNAIIWRGVQYGPSCYAMIIFDNATDNSCYVYTPSGEVSAGFPAGFYPGSGSDWLGATPCVTNPCINLGQWYCIWVSYDAPSGKLDVYVDGILRVSLLWPNQYGAPSVDDLFIGSSDNVPGGLYPYYFNGVIDDIAIYGGPLVCPLSCDSAENGYARKTIENAIAVSGNDIQVVPNPTSDKVELITPSEWSASHITLLNSVGQVISTRKVDASGKTQISLTNVPAGLYLLRVESNGKYCVKKVLKN